MLHQKNFYFKKIFPILPSVNNNNLPHIIWGHGWGQDHTSLCSLATSLQNVAYHWLLDFPGFGASFIPNHNLTPDYSHSSTSVPSSSVWGSEDYANVTLKWIKQNIPPNAIKIWIGHSFGGRVGINLAADNPNLLNGLILIAGAGIPQPMRIIKNINKFIKTKLFKLLKHILILTNNYSYLNYVKNKFGSYDYKNATPEMRKILVKIIHEDLTNKAKKIKCPTELIYGLEDQETPAIIGKKLEQLIDKSKLHLIPRKNHWNILEKDSYQVIHIIKKFIAKF